MANHKLLLLELQSTTIRLDVDFLKSNLFYFSFLLWYLNSVLFLVSLGFLSLQAITNWLSCRSERSFYFSSECAKGDCWENVVRKQSWFPNGRRSWAVLETKLSPIFGFATRAIANRRSKSFKYKTNFPLSQLHNSVAVAFTDSIDLHFYRYSYFSAKSFFNNIVKSFQR